MSNSSNRKNSETFGKALDKLVDDMSKASPFYVRVPSNILRFVERKADYMFNHVISYLFRK